MVFVTTFYKYIIQQYFTVTAPHSVLRAIIPSLQISTPTAVLRFDSVVGRMPAMHFTLVIINSREVIQSATNLCVLCQKYLSGIHN